VSIRETYPLRGELVDARRRDLGFAVVTAKIAVPEVIDQDDEDVGFAGRGRLGGAVIGGKRKDTND
jgi:hypothetical protein